MKKLLGGVSYANVTATLALIIALGGVAWAAETAKKNSVVSKSIKNGQVKTADIADESIFSPKIGPSAVASDEVANSSLGADDLAAGSVTADQIAAGAVNSDEIGAGQVGDAAVPDVIPNLSIISLQNGWSASPIATIHKDVQGVVRLVGGVVGSSATPGPAFTLPVGQRPVAEVMAITGCAGNGMALVAINGVNGQVTITSLTGPTCLTNIPLNGLDWVGQ